MKSKTLLALDVGEKRIGVATGDTAVRIAVPIDTIEVDGTEIERIARIVVDENVDTIVVGYPRNQSGEPTAQTAFVEAFAAKLTDLAPKVVFQDESLTSVLAEQRLKSYGKPYTKGDIDAQAAAMILQDYLEQQ
ncbi:Holliday junction resolvase RuvX [Streptomyces caniscabiei]|uniref:Holliday junction resolvase RuvX n=1 Tax=Streptomyces caniscabiei TaxID=2746961 RepID=UPI0029A0E6CB|nr:Holliday junction resolvase RuvX [Streptomyces caniscabiei]MDX2776699.1 Holliday junction resolvase RuvX [Streptomyces caniscabiei]